MYALFSLTAIRDKKTGVIRNAANILLENIPLRIKLTEEIIAAAILDPSVQHFDAIDEWLTVHNISRTELLQNVIRTYSINIATESTRAQPSLEHEQSVDIRLLLLQECSMIPTNDSSLESEINRFRGIKEAVSDVLGFWREQEVNFPQLGGIARVILSKPATSAKSESAFSVAGALISKKRAQLDPLRSQKVLFIHDNFNLLNCSDF